MYLIICYSTTYKFYITLRHFFQNAPELDRLNFPSISNNVILQRDQHSVFFCRKTFLFWPIFFNTTAIISHRLTSSSLRFTRVSSTRANGFDFQRVFVRIKRSIARVSILTSVCREIIVTVVGICVSTTRPTPRSYLGANGDWSKKGHHRSTLIVLKTQSSLSRDG